MASTGYSKVWLSEQKMLNPTMTPKCKREINFSHGTTHAGKCARPGSRLAGSAWRAAWSLDRPSPHTPRAAFVTAEIPWSPGGQPCGRRTAASTAPRRFPLRGTSHGPTFSLLTGFHLSVSDTRTSTSSDRDCLSVSSSWEALSEYMTLDDGM